MNFVHHIWPNLLKHNVVEQFITPIVKVSLVLLTLMQFIVEQSITPIIKVSSVLLTLMQV